MKKTEDGKIHVSTHSGKMLGIPSIGTYCGCNRLCMARMKNPKNICSKCYASTLGEHRKSMREALTRNYGMLTKSILPDSAFPTLNALWVRIESFGDVVNVTQARNYIKLCRLNPQATFAAWTKNLYIWESAFVLDGKPENLVFVFSSPRIGVVAETDSPYVDHIFTVMPKGTPESEINCGARSCLTCRRCYRKDTDRYVYELVK